MLILRKGTQGPGGWGPCHGLTTVVPGLSVLAQSPFPSNLLPTEGQRWYSLFTYPLVSSSSNTARFSWIPCKHPVTFKANGKIWGWNTDCFKTLKPRLDGGKEMTKRNPQYTVMTMSQARFSLAQKGSLRQLQTSILPASITQESERICLEALPGIPNNLKDHILMSVCLPYHLPTKESMWQSLW